MRVGVLGTGMVGEAIASKLVALGHEVCMGSRSASNDKARAWAERAGARATVGTFADAARFGELSFLCTSGAAALDALALAGDEALSDKVLIDVTNPLAFTPGQLPTLFVGNDDSLGERIQRAHPQARVVKTLNTMNCDVMVDPSLVPGEQTTFVAGDDADAKRTVIALLTEQFGHRDVIDLGDIRGARATESMMHVWLALYRRLGTDKLNFKIVR